MKKSFSWTRLHKESQFSVLQRGSFIFFKGKIQKLFKTSVDDAYNRLIKPKIIRQSR